MEKILKQINKIVTEKELTQEYLSKKMNISRSYVSMLLNGERTLNKELIVNFSEALSISLEELLNIGKNDDYVIKTRGMFQTRTSRSKLSKIKVQMDDYLRLKGIYSDEYTK
ncbi:MAG TPA: helix-turn-helix transcriptional regulator [Candidatus Enterococcus avicola]|uniref:Helix-turn-helix transcriptional regulator n=1 Tax=Candidatus Enterococcus avicola TaxID=2838561 RepID=A0A9D2F5B9_9ENTE|nr:helix-turn-helix transcriptional regulator [Candidatus Enterococcus avicola]